MEFSSSLLHGPFSREGQVRPPCLSRQLFHTWRSLHLLAGQHGAGAPSRLDCPTPESCRDGAQHTPCHDLQCDSLHKPSPGATSFSKAPLGAPRHARPSLHGPPCHTALALLLPPCSVRAAEAPGASIILSKSCPSLGTHCSLHVEGTLLAHVSQPPDSCALLTGPTLPDTTTSLHSEGIYLLGLAEG